MVREELCNPFGFVGREVIEDDVDLFGGRLGGNHIGVKGHELRAGMALASLADDRTASVARS